MEDLVRIVLPQDKESPITYVSKGNYHFRYAFSRANDTQNANDNGQDFLWIQTDDNRFVFVLCDGVGQSFYGDLAAKFLGEKLGMWFWELKPDTNENEIKTTLSKELLEITDQATLLVQNQPIPDFVSPMVRFVLEKKRSLGSESVFIAGMIDNTERKAYFAWMGDSRLRFINTDVQRRLDGLFKTSERWSSIKGPIGELHVVSLDITAIDHFVAYSDGFSYIDKFPLDEPYFSNQALDCFISDSALFPSSDDISFLEFWNIQSEPKFAENAQELKISRLDHYFDDNKYFFSWQQRISATEYEVRFYSSNKQYMGTSKTSKLHLSYNFDAHMKYAAIRPWKGNEPGYWSDLIELKHPESSSPTVKQTVAPYKPAQTTPPPYYIPKHQTAPLPSTPPLYIPPPAPMATPPPPLAAPVYRLLGLAAIATIIVAFISFIAVLALSSLPANPAVSSPAPIWWQITIVIKGILTASLLSLIPTFAAWVAGIKNRVRLAATELLLFAIAATIICYVLTQFKGNNWWLLFAVFIIMFLVIGAHIIDSIREATFRRIDKTWQYKSLRKDAASFDELYRYERILYAALPLGIMIGTVWGVIKSATEIQIALFSIQSVLLAASLILILVTFKSFQQMLVPMYRLSNSPNQPPIFTRKQRDDAKNKEEKMLSLAIMSTDLRKLHLYDSTHNILLMLLFVYAILMTYGITIEFKFLILVILIATLIFSQFPYVLGQYFLHQKVLEPFEGLAKSEVDEQIKKCAPLYPTFHFLAALLTSGTAGGLAFFLLDNFIKGLFK